MNVVLVGMTGMGNAALAALVDAGVNVPAVITEPASGPGFPHYPCVPLTELCRQRGVPVRSDLHLTADPDALVIATSHRIIPDDLIRRLGGRVINCHPALLPRHRGPTPIPWTIEQGDTETGLTYIRPTAELDAGPIWRQVRTPIRPDETAGALRYRLDQVLVPQTLPELVRDVVAARVEPQPQTGPSTYEGRFPAMLGAADWASLSTAAALRRFRACTPFPGTFVTCGTNRLRLTHLRAMGSQPMAPPGTVRRTDDDVILINTRDGQLAGRAVSDTPAG